MGHWIHNVDDLLLPLGPVSQNLRLFYRINPANLSNILKEANYATFQEIIN